MADERVAAPPGVASLSARQLAELLLGLQGRPAQALTLRVLEGRPREACAAFFGIHPAAFDVMLLRAAQALEAAAWPGPSPLLRTDEERVQAEQLARALESEESTAGARLAPEVKRHAWVLHHLRALAGPVRAEIEALERAAESSPRARRQLWARRVLVVLLVAVAFYLYQRQQAHPPGPAVRPRAAPDLRRPSAHQRTAHEAPPPAAPGASAPRLSQGGVHPDHER